MGETALVNANLTPELIEVGRTLVLALDGQAVGIEAALWLLDEGSGSWHLVLGARAIRKRGSFFLYQKVNRILLKLGLQDRLWIGMVSIVDQHSPMIRALSDTLGAAASVDGARLDNAVVNGIRMPGCLLYRITVKQKLIPSTVVPSDVPGQSAPRATLPRRP